MQQTAGSLGTGTQMSLFPARSSLGLSELASVARVHLLLLSVSQTAWARAGQSKSPERGTALRKAGGAQVTRKNKPSRYLLWRAVHARSVGTWHRSICWGH